MIFYFINLIHSGKWIFIRFNPDRTRTDKTDSTRTEIVLLSY
jgi:hypothetical protein